MAAYHSYEDELLMDARQKAAAQQREMRQLEARLAEAAIKQQGRSRRGGGGSESTPTPRRRCSRKRRRRSTRRLERDAYGPRQRRRRPCS